MGPCYKWSKIEMGFTGVKKISYLQEVISPLYERYTQASHKQRRGPFLVRGPQLNLH